MALQEDFELQGRWLFRNRGWLPVLLLAAGLAVFTVEDFVSGTCFSVMPSLWHWYEWLCLAVSMAGLAARAYIVGHTPAGTSGRNTKRQVADSLNTTGAYSVVRHPLYFANFLIYLGIAMLTGSYAFVLVFVLAFWLYYERIMYAEECFLRQKFGAAYTDWAAATPAFIPCLSGFRRCALGFSWKKVVKKEKNGLFAIMLVFSVFDYVNATFGRGQTVNAPLLSLAAVSGFAYIILKVIKRHTSWLDEAGR